MPKNPLGRLREGNGPKSEPVSPPTPEPAGNVPKPARPDVQGDRKPGLDVAKEILGTKYKAPSDIPVPDELPPGYDRMAEIAKANSARVQAFSGGVPDNWSAVSLEPEVVEPEPEEPAIVEATE